MIGLKRGTVQLCPHQKSWDISAQETITILKSILGDSAVDIQHIGSSSIPTISSKPIIDIAVGVKNLEDIKSYIPALESKGIIYRGSDHENQLLFVIGDFENDSRSHHIHVIKYNNDEWNNYTNFRDYLIEFPDEAKKYEKLKIDLAEKYPNDGGAYTEGKKELISKILNDAKIWRKRK